MNREYIRAVKSRYSKQQHQSIIEAYLFGRLPVETIASSYGAGEMDITVILSSYRVLLSCPDKDENLSTLKYMAERGDRSIIIGQYVDLYYDSDLADVSPVLYFNAAKNEIEAANQQKQSIDNRVKEVKVAKKTQKKKKRRKSVTLILVRVFACVILAAVIILLPVYVYNSSKVAGDRNSDLSVYAYDCLGGSYGGQGQKEPSGLGRLFTDEYDYVGQFSGGEIRGNGCFLSSQNVSYVGGVNYGKKHGLGIEIISEEKAAVLGVRKDGLLNGTGLKISEKILELSEYSGGTVKTTLAIGNYENVNFNIKNSAYNLKLADGWYKLGKANDLNSVTGFIVEWQEQTENSSSCTIYFNEYKNGELIKSLAYETGGNITYIVPDFTISSDKDMVLCSEQGGTQNLTAQYNHYNGENSFLLGKYEGGTAIKLGRLLKSGEVVFE